VELYRINPGGLRQHGLRLPVALSVSGADPRRARRLIGMLERAGFAPARNAVADAAPEGTVSPLRLEIEILDDARAAYRVLDEDRFVGADTLTVGKLDRAGTARLARAVAEGVFQVE
jgi:hypothetical protein